jgi:hypothetical protein
MPPDRERGPARHRAPTTTSPAPTPEDTGDGSERLRQPGAIFGRHAWRWCAIRSLDRPTLGRCPRCCRCVGDNCAHPEFVEAVA